MSPRIDLVVAVASNGVIGRDNGLPWRIPADMRWFKQVTMGKPVIMGRKTWDSLPKKPLPGRVNVVVSRSSPPSLTLPRMAGSGPAMEGGGGSVHSGAHSPEPSPQGGEEVIWVKSLDEALLAPSPQPSSPEGGEGVEIELCIIGGAQIYAEALPRADRIYLTEVHAFPEGNVFMPAFDRALFTETFREDHVAEGETPAFSFVILDKRG